MRIMTIGVGYVGLVSSACLSDFGHEVICIDKNVKKINMLKNGDIPIFEPGLRSLVRRNMLAQRLAFEHNISDSIKNCEVVLVAVGTPTLKENGKADLRALFTVLEETVPLINAKQLIVIKSTTPVGTNREVREFFSKRGKGDVEIVSNPEFLREGSAIEDFMRPDRIIIGVNSRRARIVMTEMYKSLFLRDFPLVFTKPESAELIKYASNAFLATKISFINEIAIFSESSGADIKEVAKGIGLDGRIGNKFLHAGAGYGGSCFPKDTLALFSQSEDLGAPLSIIQTVIKVNEKIKKKMVEKIVNILKNKLKDKLICVLGVTFKPNTNDMREAPSLFILPALVKRGAKINVVDPKGKEDGTLLFPEAVWKEDAYEGAKGADLVIILTEWNEFRALDLKRLSESMRTPIMADLRNIYSRNEALASGFNKYVSVGRV